MVLFAREDTAKLFQTHEGWCRVAACVWTRSTADQFGHHRTALETTRAETIERVSLGTVGRAKCADAHVLLSSTTYGKAPLQIGVQRAVPAALRSGRCGVHIRREADSLWSHPALGWLAGLVQRKEPRRGEGAHHLPREERGAARS